METDEEKKRRELREEADRDTQIAREREEAQKRHRGGARRLTLESQLRQLEDTLSKNALSQRALQLEEGHLESTIKKGYSVSSRESHERVSKEEREIRDLRSTLDSLHQKERTTEESIHEHEELLSRARTTSHSTEELEERGRDAKMRQQEHSFQTRKLEAESRTLTSKIQDIKRELTKLT